MQSWTTPELTPLPASTTPPRLFDTRSGRIAPVTPVEPGHARLYICGITPYDATHLGHAATYLAFDLVQRVWRDNRVDVHYVQNATDIDDPLLERAERDGALVIFEGFLPKKREKQPESAQQPQPTE